MNLLLLLVGGGAGAVTRYLLGKIVMSRNPHPPFPIAMLFVNILGSFGLGCFYGTYFSDIPSSETYKDPLFLLIGMGFFGAFTTFSTFSVEAFQLLEDRKLKPLFFYLLFSVGGALLVFLLGALLFQ